jgi:hypothetical protein
VGKGEGNHDAGTLARSRWDMPAESHVWRKDKYGHAELKYKANCQEGKE